MEFLEGLDDFDLGVKQWDVGTARCRADPAHPHLGCTAGPSLGQPTRGAAVPSGGTGDVSAAWERLSRSEAAGRSLKHRHTHRDRQGEGSLREPWGCQLADKVMLTATASARVWAGRAPEVPGLVRGKSLVCWQRAACAGLRRQLLPSTITGWEIKELLTWSDRRSFSKVSSSCAFSSL